MRFTAIFETPFGSGGHGVLWDGIIFAGQICLVLATTRCGLPPVLLIFSNKRSSPNTLLLQSSMGSSIDPLWLKEAKWKIMLPPSNISCHRVVSRKSSLTRRCSSAHFWDCEGLPPLCAEVIQNYNACAQLKRRLTRVDNKTAPPVTRIFSPKICFIKCPCFGSNIVQISSQKIHSCCQVSW